MHVNRTRIILIVMIIATVVLGGAAIFIGWRLQTQVNTKSFAGTCEDFGGVCENNCAPGQTFSSSDCKCWWEGGHQVDAYCNMDASSTSSAPGATACTKPTGYDDPGKQWYCSCTPSETCNEGNGVTACYKNCTYTTVSYDTCQLWYDNTPNPPACTQYDYTLANGTKCYKANMQGCGNTSTSTSSAAPTTCYKCTDATDDANACQTQTTNSTCASLGTGWTSATNCASVASGGACATTTIQNTCYKCTDSENDGNACQTQTTTGTCASLGAGWTTNTLCETGATGGSCTAAIQAKVRGRVYCQDTNGPIIPISNTVVAITKGSTVINATTDSEGFYVSSNIGLPSTGDKVAVDIASLPTTFNNGLNTSQLTGKSALNCASASSLPGCSTGVSSNYYCDSVTTKGSYANCKLTTAGDSTTGHGFFDFKYTNCTATVPSCGNSVVDNGESCDPVGTVGQCTTGGKCQTGCACPTCNSACSTNDDCPDGLVCSGNKCRNPDKTSAVDCKVSSTSVPSTGFIDQNYGVLVLSIVLMLIGLAFVRNQGVISLLTNTAISLFGTNILRYVDPDGAKRYYEKNILNKQKHEAK